MIYVDNAATSWPKPPAVMGAILRTMENAGGNPGRSGHRMALQAAEIVCECRENLAELFGVEDPLRICFTANTTEALNLATKGSLRPGDHAVYSSMEHNSVWRPLMKLEQSGVQLTQVQADTSGIVSPERIADAIQPDTKMIAVTHSSNVNGAINPIAEIGAIARRKKVLFLVDAAQTAGVLPIDVRTMNIDLLAFPGHKGLLGPQGTGGLYIGRAAHLETIMEGGTGSESASASQPETLPDRYESGTVNTPGIAGLNEGVKFLLERGIEQIRLHEQALTVQLLNGLNEIPGIRIYGPCNPKTQVGVVSLTIEGLDCERAANKLEHEYQIACRAGLHCAYLAHLTQGTAKTGAVRLSLGPFVTQMDIASILGALKSISRSVRPRG